MYVCIYKCVHANIFYTNIFLIAFNVFRLVFLNLLICAVCLVFCQPVSVHANSLKNSTEARTSLKNSSKAKVKPPAAQGSSKAATQDMIHRLQILAKQFPSAHESARIQENDINIHKNNSATAGSKTNLEMKLIPPLPSVKMDNQKDPFGPDIKAPLIHLAR